MDRVGVLYTLVHGLWETLPGSTTEIVLRDIIVTFSGEMVYSVFSLIPRQVNKIVAVA